jgi:hypothetical protein
MWFVQRKEILTKDNLLKRNWQGSRVLFLWSWRVYTTHIHQVPFCKNHLADLRNRILDLVYAPFYRQYGMFRMVLSLTNHFFPTFLQVIPLAIHWIHMWSYLWSADQRRDMDIKCNRLKMVARDIYSRFSWRFDGHLTCWRIGLLWFFVSLDGWSMCPPYVILDL